MTLEWLIGWWNLVFLVPFAIALTYLALYVSTGITFGDASADAEAQGDFHADAHGDFHADGHGEVHGDAHGDLHAEAHADHPAGADHHGHGHDAHSQEAAKPSGSHGSSFSIFNLIGVGRVPMSLVLMILLFSWGISGFATTQTLHKSMESGDQIALIAIPVAAVVSICVTALITRFVGRVFPMNERPAMGLPQLVGETGVAVLPINEAFGLARVAKADGAGIQVPCRVAPGQPSIATHERVVLLRFDRAQRVFYVTAPEAASATTPEGVATS